MKGKEKAIGTVTVAVAVIIIIAVIAVASYYLVNEGPKSEFKTWLINEWYPTSDNPNMVAKQVGVESNYGYPIDSLMSQNRLEGVILANYVPTGAKILNYSIAFTDSGHTRGEVIVIFEQ